MCVCVKTFVVLGCAKLAVRVCHQRSTHPMQIRVNVLVMVVTPVLNQSTLYLPDFCCYQLVQKMAADQGNASLALDPSKIGSEDYLSSLTRRLDVLEKKLVGDSGIKEDQPPLKTTVNVSSASDLPCPICSFDLKCMKL